MDEPIKVVAGVLQSELGLKPDQVMLYNQKFDIPPDDRLYVTLSLLGSRTFGASTRYENNPISDELQETQRVNQQQMLSITLMSRSSEARVNNWRVPAALVSTYSQQQQEANSIKIGQVPTSMNDVSDVEGTARLNKYSLTFLVLAAYSYVKPTQFFDSFGGPEIITNQ